MKKISVLIVAIVILSPVTLYAQDGNRWMPELLIPLEFDNGVLEGVVTPEQLEVASHWYVKTGNLDVPLFEPCAKQETSCDLLDLTKPCKGDRDYKYQCVYSCADYKKVIAEGWSADAYDNMIAKREAFFIHACQGLDLLRFAKQKSQNDSSRLLEAVKALPPYIDDYIERTLEPLAVADFNHDGYDDVLVFQALSEGKRTFRGAQYQCFSFGAKKNETLTEVSCIKI